MPTLDTRLDWEAIEATASGEPIPHQGSVAPPAGPEAPRDPLMDPLDTPIRRLTAPLAVKSGALDEIIYLVADDHQAATVRARGGVPYTSEEIDILWQLHQAISPEAWPERLRAIHEGKRQLGGTVTGWRPDAKG